VKSFVQIVANLPKKITEVKNFAIFGAKFGQKKVANNFGVKNVPFNL
jgi:hypothetical protein